MAARPETVDDTRVWWQRPRGGAEPLDAELLADTRCTDTLTGLPDRAWLRRQIEDRRGVDTKGGPLSVLLVDLDDFKAVNDTLGHQHGDRLLCLVAERLRACLGPGERLVRGGGDEFIVLSHRLPRAAEQLAGCIALALEAPFVLGGAPFYMSCSVGIVTRGHGWHPLEQLLAHAGVALAEAKRRGAGHCVCHTVELSERATEKLTLRQALHAAVPEREFELHFQPQVDLLTGEVLGAEALLRWRHPQRGLLKPDYFIRLAEETGRIVPIGQWVLAEAARTAAAWNRGRERPLKMAVNVSPRQFAEPGLAAVVARTLAQAGCEPGWLELEITEGLLLSDNGRVRHNLGSVAALGVRVAIDDFGTGHSALNYLTRFPVDVLKIDRSFVSGMEFEPRRAALVQAMVSMAQALDLHVVAEGIEHAAQAALLVRQGCHTGQGLHFGGPVPAALFGAPP